jgi:hypothetical protein
MSEALHCPISMDLLEDPVSTPCCGNAFSREPLAAYLQHNNRCPLCRADLAQDHPTFDVATAARNRTIAGLVDALRASGGSSGSSGGVASTTLPSPSGTAAASAAQGPMGRATLAPIVTKSGVRLPVGRLSLRVDWPDFEGDVCLFLPVIDKRYVRQCASE